ncbi:MAG: SymE family type I addiction module toxin [Dysgonomonas sp.]
MKNIDDIHIRNLTVYGHFSPRQWSKYAMLPQIRLIGKWLRDAGFEVEDKIKIVVSNKCLVIVPDEKKKEDL